MIRLSQSRAALIGVFAAWFALILLVQLYYIPAFQGMTGSELLDLGGFTVETIDDVLATYGADGLALYRHIQVVDFIVPLLLGTLLAGLSLRSLAKDGPPLLWLGFFPFSLTIFDYTENIIVFNILSTFPEPISPSLASTLLTVITIKNAAYVASAMLTLGLILRAWVRRSR